MGKRYSIKSLIWLEGPDGHNAVSGCLQFGALGRLFVIVEGFADRLLRVASRRAASMYAWALGHPLLARACLAPQGAPLAAAAWVGGTGDSCIDAAREVCHGA